jgi:hypothetical protein
MTSRSYEAGDHTSTFRIRRISSQPEDRPEKNYCGPQPIPFSDRRGAENAVLELLSVCIVRDRFSECTPKDKAWR